MTNVIYYDFTRRAPDPAPKMRARGIGAFIKLPDCQTAMYMLGGNVAGFVESWIAFHEDFDPRKYGVDERSERGVNIDSEPDPDGPSAA